MAAALRDEIARSMRGYFSIRPKLRQFQVTVQRDSGRLLQCSTTLNSIVPGRRHRKAGNLHLSDEDQGPLPLSYLPVASVFESGKLRRRSPH
jgi:hypothetical protein